MNGRMYDPVIGRILSPDPFVSSPTNTKSYNRYSYCRNNPLRYTDPSGYVDHPADWGMEPYFPLAGYDIPWKLGAVGPGSGNHWSDQFRSEVSNFIFGSQSSYDNIYGKGAYQIAIGLASDPTLAVKWRQGLITIENIKESGGYWVTNTYTLQSPTLYDHFGNLILVSLPTTVVFKQYIHVPGPGAKGVLSGHGVNEVSQAGLNFIAGYEGYSATTYKDVAGLPTIGYGHLIKPGESFGSLSKDAALELLRKDVSFAVNAVNKYVTVPLSQNQFDALTSLTFNIGTGAFSKSTVLRNVNSGNILSIEKSFLMWNKARIDGVLTPVRGLTNRRQAEASLFLNEDY